MVTTFYASFRIPRYLEKALHHETTKARVDAAASRVKNGTKPLRNRNARGMALRINEPISKCPRAFAREMCFRGPKPWSGENISTGSSRVGPELLLTGLSSLRPYSGKKHQTYIGTL